MNNVLADEQQRTEALDPKQSFIVQAPAGSGKTELLVQRYLTLLRTVQNPEEILAITFTRKAAHEMRARIILALQTEKNHLAWQILENTQRLRVQTFDSFCAYLTQRMPLTSQFGSQADVVEDAEEYYAKAARAVLMSLETAEASDRENLKNILLHLNNDYVAAEKLFVDMLSRREQWLPYVLAAKKNTAQLRNYLEKILKNISLEIVKKCSQHFPDNLLDELLILMQFATKNLKHVSFSKFSNDDIESISQWKEIASFLLTKDSYEWRKKMDVRHGFPANEKSMKARMQQLLQDLSANSFLLESLQQIAIAPYGAYSQTEWQVIEPLIAILPLLVAQLLLVFKEYNKVDFNQIAAMALTALGEIDNPTDLALNLDYQIKHILIDEFQDTSATQFRLLEHLTAGWQRNDGRTLFLVGDPMQSIYRFRKADVRA